MHDFVANRGGLTIASECVVAIYRETEKCFPRLKNSNDGYHPHGGGIPEAIACAVLMNQGDKSFFPKLHVYMFYSSYEVNHQHNLLKYVARHLGN